jgi:general secretion pathway protein C
VIKSFLCGAVRVAQSFWSFSSRSPSSAPQAGAAGAYEFTESGFARGREGNIVADRRWVDKALTTDFAKTLQDAKASPNLVNGEVKGFVLTRIRPDSVYEKMGFQDGDVVEQINGIDLNDAARAIQTLNSLKNENAIELMVKRNGVAMPLKIQVK